MFSSQIQANAMSFAQKLRSMGKKGESAYGNVNGEDVTNIPAQACIGRAGVLGSTFSGFIDLESGKMRIDCAEDPSFWLEVDLSKVPALFFHPEAEGGAESVQHAKTISERI